MGGAKLLILEAERLDASGKPVNVGFHFRDHRKSNPSPTNFNHWETIAGFAYSSDDATRRCLATTPVVCLGSGTQARAEYGPTENAGSKSVKSTVEP
ncbi:hypothetical protein AB0H88_39945 [Nonomuraea sp. NPDC050680]|uniref:hypothetical protein n=1 Tax=Nonomuraea sp. NPDC050680 TaxID=3154630 RepID=UPI0033EC8B5D